MGDAFPSTGLPPLCFKLRTHYPELVYRQPGCHFAQVNILGHEVSDIFWPMESYFQRQGFFLCLTPKIPLQLYIINCPRFFFVAIVDRYVNNLKRMKHGPMFQDIVVQQVGACVCFIFAIALPFRGYLADGV